MHYFYQRYDLPAEHARNGGTFVTNTSGTQTAAISASVEAFGDPAIYMKGHELHTTRRPFNLSDFWKFHESRQASTEST